LTSNRQEILIYFGAKSGKAWEDLWKKKIVEGAESLINGVIAVSTIIGYNFSTVLAFTMRDFLDRNKNAFSGKKQFFLYFTLLE